MKKALALNLGLLSLLCLFLLILSVLGFRVVISQSLGHHNYIINVLMILECWGKTGFFKNPKKPFFLKRSCRKFYEATIAFFFTLFVFFAFYAIKGKVPDTITFIQGSSSLWYSPSFISSLNMCCININGVGIPWGVDYS
ncbi:MAG: hypothetical protein AYK18_13895 [Theionarchaea archaeon DG-70]|nr:MAG: hypothetical protein AYK18_13895 [Theionarchaea archaeon DG-70]